MAALVGTLAFCLQLKLDQWEVAQECQEREGSLGCLFPDSLAVESPLPVCWVALLAPSFLSLKFGNHSGPGVVTALYGY